MLRAGDSLILFSDGVTEARNGADRSLYGDERLRRLVAGLGDLPAVAMAERRTPGPTRSGPVT